MARKKEWHNDKKWFVHSLNIKEYKEYTVLIKGWIEAKKYTKGRLLQDIKDNKTNVKKQNNINMFFIIYNTFMPILKTFKNSKALNLYIYCGLTMDYELGYLKEDLKEISNLFKCTQRVVYKWLRQLETMGVIFIIKSNGEKYIFINPYGIIPEDNYTKEDSFENLISKYKEWVKVNQKSQTLFFSIHHNFEEYLYTISGGALKLYIYCGLNTNKSTKQDADKPLKKETCGTFFQSLKVISEKLAREADETGKVGKISIKTISGWFKELKELHIVEKYQLKLNMASTIYVKPIIKIKDLEKYKWLTELKNFEYIGNTDTNVLHHKDCISIKHILKINKKYFNDIKIAEAQNFKQCNVCIKQGF
jgi:hypothetical protein